MHRRIQGLTRFLLMFGVLSLLSALPASGHSSMQEDVTILDDPTSCIVGVTPEMLGSGSPANAEGYSLVSARLTFAPGATIGAHIHPGTLVATVVEGSLGFTLISDGQMDINRAPAADGTRATDVAMPGQEVLLEAGDGFVETGMVHSARNASEGETVVIISGLTVAGQGLTQCVQQ